MPFGACETGVSRTTSAGARVIAGAACDMICILAHASNPGFVGGIFRHPEAGQTLPLRGQLRPSLAYYNAVVADAGGNDRGPRWFWIPVRVLLVTLVLTLLSFAISLLLGIVGLVIGSRLRRVPPNLPFAYRHIALPAAGVVGAVVLVSSLFMEIRHFRQAKALASIERAD
jgi:hypothetical protein